MTKKLPELLEDMLARSAKPHMDSTEANDALNLMEVFGEPPAESSTLRVCEFESESCGPSVHFVVQSTDLRLIASEIPQFATSME